MAVETRLGGEDYEIFLLLAQVNLLVAEEYKLLFATIFHLILNLTSLLFTFQMCLLSVVAFFLQLFPKPDVCWF